MSDGNRRLRSRRPYPAFWARMVPIVLVMIVVALVVVVVLVVGVVLGWFPGTGWSELGSGGVVWAG